MEFKEIFERGKIMKIKTYKFKIGFWSWFNILLRGLTYTISVVSPDNKKFKGQHASVILFDEASEIMNIDKIEEKER